MFEPTTLAQTGQPAHLRRSVSARRRADRARACRSSLCCVAARASARAATPPSSGAGCTKPSRHATRGSTRTANSRSRPPAVGRGALKRPPPTAAGWRSRRQRRTRATGAAATAAISPTDVPPCPLTNASLAAREAMAPGVGKSRQRRGASGGRAAAGERQAAGALRDPPGFTAVRPECGAAGAGPRQAAGAAQPHWRTPAALGRLAGPTAA